MGSGRKSQGARGSGPVTVTGKPLIVRSYVIRATTMPTQPLRHVDDVGVTVRPTEICRVARMSTLSGGGPFNAYKTQ